MRAQWAVTGSREERALRWAGLRHVSVRKGGHVGRGGERARMPNLARKGKREAADPQPLQSLSRPGLQI